MKKIISSVIIGFLIIGGLGAVAFDNSDHITKIKEIIHISQPVIKDSDKYVNIDFEESDSYICNPGKPLLPTVTRIFTFPLGTKIVDVDVRCEYEEYVLSKKIHPAPRPKIISKEVSQELHEVVPDEKIYASLELYPSEPYILSRGAGLQDGNHVLFLNVKVAPQYSPLLNLLLFPQEIEITVEYQLPEEPLFTADEYDMVIIAPSQFSSTLQPLIDHKLKYGMRTFLKTTNEIYDEYEGRDQAEQIKYFIKDAIETFGIFYVLLMGNIDLVPIRLAAIQIDVVELKEVPTDLYYADLYDDNGSFSSWDSNNNDIFSELIYDANTGKMQYIDLLDLYSDVGVGRLPCNNMFEVKIVVNKIMYYESKTYGQEWFNKLILMGGDTTPESGLCEGEIVTEQIAQLMPAFQHIKLWTSKNTFSPFLINQEINKGAGFVSYSGHGYEYGIGTFSQGGENFIKYFTPYLIGLHNNKLPIIFIDACLTSRLDFTIGDIKLPCFAWSIVKKLFGGAIASIGATRVASEGIIGNNIIDGCVLLHVKFFNAYNSSIFLSQMLMKAQNEYLNTVTWYKDYLTLEEFILVGDPSLKVGGYE